MERRELARIISSPAGMPRGIAPDRGDDLLELSRSEGVVALASLRLQGDPAVPALVRDAFAAASRSLAAAHLALEAETRKVLGALHGAGIPVLVLKGTALGQWLFPAAYLRECSDIDLLFASRADANSAASVLAVQGYTALYSPGDMAHEFPCRRETLGLQIDLDMHWRLANLPVFRELFPFDELLAGSIPLPGLSEHGRGLGPAQAFVHACIHRASNLCAGLGDRLKWLHDLHLLAGKFTPEEWDELRGLCVERGLCGICAEGINASVDLFGTVVPERVHEALRAGRAHESLDASRLSDWKYMQQQNLAALPTLSEKLRWLWQRAFPPRGYLLELYGADAGVFGIWWRRMKRGIGRFLG